MKRLNLKACYIFLTKQQKNITIVNNHKIFADETLVVFLTRYFKFSTCGSRNLLLRIEFLKTNVILHNFIIDITFILVINYIMINENSHLFSQY